MPALDPRVVLRLLIDRVEREVGNVTRAQLRREQWPGGRGHLADALLRSREALASDDDERIRDAVPLCQALERTGRTIVEQRAAEERRLAQEAHEAKEASHEAKEAARRRKGGENSSKAQAAERERDWAPWTAKFHERRARGEDEGPARRAVVREMQQHAEEKRDGFPSAEAFPDRHTMARRLSDRKPAQ